VDIGALSMMRDLLMFLVGSSAITLWALLGLVIDEMRRWPVQLEASGTTR
jgi:hypothetical protein